AMFKEYDFPKESSNGPSQPSNDGSDWMLGTPSDLNGMVGVHDVQADLDGNLWIAYSLPSRDTTVAKIDAKTGAVKKFGVPDIEGFAAGSHGIVRDENGNLWFNTRSTVERSHGSLAKIDPKTEKISVYTPPKPMSGTAGTLDVDLKGNVWVRQFVRRHARAHRHQDEGDQARAAAEPGGASALSSAGRFQAQRLDQPVEH